MRTLAVLPLLFLPVVALGDCTEHLETWAQALHPTLEFDSKLAACKVNPADESQVLAALPIVERFEEDEDNNTTGLYGLEVLVVDTATGKVIAHDYQGAAIESDAFQFTGLQLDTARYQVGSGLRAFGVRINHRVFSGASPSRIQALSLYLQDASGLRRIMDKLVVSASYTDWDMRCEGEFRETARTLAIGKPGKDGFAGLRISEKSTVRNNVAKGEDCEEIQGKPKMATFTLDYDGRQYPVPKGLSF